MNFQYLKTNKIIHYKLKSIITGLFIGTISIILLIPTSTALAKDTTVSINQEAQQLSNKIKSASPNSLISTINNNGKLIDLKKDNEGKVYLTEHNSEQLLIDPNEIHANSCSFWVTAAVLTIGLIVFIALAMTGVGAVLDTLVVTFKLSWVYLDAALVASGVLGGWSVLFLGQWIAAKVCGTELPKEEEEIPNKHHWDQMPKQGSSIPVQMLNNKEAVTLSNKIREASPNTKVATVNNNGSLIDLKKDSEGKVYVTEHNSSNPLINPNNIHTNSCEFWINTAVITIGILIFVALAMVTGSLGEFLITTFGLAAIIGLDIAMLIDGILAGFDIYWIADIISDFVCNKGKREDKHHWDKMPKQGNGIPLRASIGILRNNHILLKNNEVIIHDV